MKSFLYVLSVRDAKLYVLDIYKLDLRVACSLSRRSSKPSVGDVILSARDVNKHSIRYDYNLSLRLIYKLSFRTIYKLRTSF